VAKTIRTPEIGQEIFVVVKGCRTEYNRLHKYNESTGRPFTVIKRLPYLIIATDDDGDEWHFPAADFSFIEPYKAKETK